jgi:hypothetical protein
LGRTIKRGGIEDEQGALKDLSGHQKKRQPDDCKLDRRQGSPLSQKSAYDRRERGLAGTARTARPHIHQAAQP